MNVDTALLQRESTGAPIRVGMVGTSLAPLIESLPS
jgi:predicted homoserine dehydrogenase-like protein